MTARFRARAGPAARASAANHDVAITSHRASAQHEKGSRMRSSTRLLHLLLVPLALFALAAAPARAAVTFTRLAPLPFPVNQGGVDFGDYDNDGLLDLAVCGYDSTGVRTTRIFHNTGNGASWTDIGAGLVGVIGGTVRWGDYDGDGRLDLLVTGQSASGDVCLLYHNTGSGFVNAGAGLPGVHNSTAVWGDVDNDGDLDILINNLDGPPTLLRNDGGNRNNWVLIKCVGTKSNRSAIGTRVKITANGRTQIDEVMSGSSYYSQNDLRLHFGLGRAARVESVDANSSSEYGRSSCA